MIPKVIHYCWFGGNPKPDDVKRCIESWKRYCRGYEIIEWNESNYDVTKNNYMRQAYDAKYWGFVPDYARLDIIYHYGGIYFDTDVELIRPPDDLLGLKAFMGLERPGLVALGLGFGAERGHPLIKELLDYYEQLDFVNERGEYDLTPSPKHQAAVMAANGLSGEDADQVIAGANVFRTEYFCPLDFRTNELRVTDHTYSIHHFNASWHTPDQARLRRLRRTLLKKNVPEGMRELITLPLRIKIRMQTNGLKNAVRYAAGKLRPGRKKKKNNQ